MSSSLEKQLKEIEAKINVFHAELGLAEKQAELIKHQMQGGIIQARFREGWIDINCPVFSDPIDDYRKKPAPEIFYIRKARNGSVHETYTEAEMHASLFPSTSFRKCIEVMDD